MRVRAAIAFVALQLAAFAASACSCMHGDIDTESARAADTVFVFQLLSAKYVREDFGDHAYSEGAEGSIRVVTSVRGDGERFDRITYLPSRCCGSRLDVGHYYIAFVSDPGPSFHAGADSVIAIGERFLDPKPPGDPDALLMRIRD
ncbi:MAG TPA: hypothetical protein VFL14_00320, partial [Xanthomonadales bacterium]|nr:hypothetical protein [Xanthomonadales bacterium]